MTKDIVHIIINENKVDIEHIGECEVNRDKQVLVKGANGNVWETFDCGYVVNEPEEIASYLRYAKRVYREHIQHFVNLIDTIDLELLKQLGGKHYN